MQTIDQIEDFTAFAKSQLGSGQERSIDELYDEWRQQAFRNTDALAVQASIRDIENGERGQALDEFLVEFDAERKESTDK